MESSEVIISNLSENEIWSKWMRSSQDEKPKFIPSLVKCLQKHAQAVCWTKLHEPRPEIIDEAVWKAFENADSFKGDSLFSSWFHRIILNCINDHLRSKQSKAEVSLEEVPEVSIQKGSDAAIELNQITLPLKSRQKHLISLKLQGLTDAEIGEILGIKELAVRHFWTRTKERIRQNSHGRTNVE